MQHFSLGFASKGDLMRLSHEMDSNRLKTLNPKKAFSPLGGPEYPHKRKKEMLHGDRA